MPKTKTSSGDAKAVHPYLRGVAPSDITRARIVRESLNGPSKWVEVYVNNKLIFSNKPKK